MLSNQVHALRTALLIGLLALSLPVWSPDSATLSAQAPTAEVPQQTPPQRIVSLLPSLTEMIYAVGAGSRVVGVTEYCTFPPEASGLPKIGGYVPRSMSLESIVALRPDLVLAAGDIQQPVIDELRRLGLRVETIVARDVQGVLEGIRRTGRLLGQDAEAEATVAGIEDDLDTLQQRLATLEDTDRPLVFYEVWHEPLMTAGGRSFISQLIEMAGGQSLFHEVDREYFQVSFEDLIHRRPQVILGAAIEGGMGDLGQLVTQPGWRELPAVQHGRVHAIDGDIVSRPGPRLAEALERIARHLHPDRFSTADADDASASQEPPP